MRNLVRFVLALVALFVALPAVALKPPVLGSHGPIDAPLVSARAGRQDSPTIACGTSGCIAAWVSGSHVEAIVLNPTTLAPSAVFDVYETIPSDPPEYVALSVRGGRVLVAWKTLNNSEIYARFLTLSSGALTHSTDAFSIGPCTMGNETCTNVAVAVGNTDSLVTWIEPGDAFQVNGILVNDSGATLHTFDVSSPPMPTDYAINEQTTIFDGTNYFAGWIQTLPMGALPEVWTRLIHPNGATAPTLDAVVTAVSPGADDAQLLSIATNGNGFAVVWPSQSMFIRGQVFDNAGARVGSDVTILQSDGVNVGAIDRPRVAHVGGNYIAVWEAYDFSFSFNHLRASRLNSALSLQDTEGGVSGVRIAPEDLTNMILPGIRPMLATSGSKAIVLMSIEDIAFQPDVYAHIVDPAALSPLPPPNDVATLISLGSSQEFNRSTASNGTNFLVVWEDDRNVIDERDVWGARFDPDGAIVGAPFLIAGGAGNQFVPAVAAQPNGNYLVAFADDSGGVTTIFAQLVTPGGALSGSKFQVPSMSPGKAQTAPVVAVGAGQFLVAWEDWAIATGSFIGVPGQIKASIVPAAGAPTMSFTVDNGSLATGSCAPSAAFDGTNFLIAYEKPCGQSRLNSGVYPDVFARRVHPDMAVDGELPISVVANVYDRHPWVTSDGAGTFYVSWTQEDTGAAGSKLRASAITSAATTTQTILSLSAKRSIESATVTISPPSNLVFSWVDTTSGSVRVLRVSSDLSSAPVLGSDDVSQVITPTQGIPLVGLDVINNGNNIGNRLAGALRATPPPAMSFIGQKGLLALTRYLGPSGAYIARVETQAMRIPAELGEGCTDGNQCGSGFCADGRCCESACDGACQACGDDGLCNVTPPSDDACAAAGVMISCASRSTECRTYADAPANMCASFGQCITPELACLTFSNANNGKACSAILCDTGGMCMDGACVCPSSLTNLPAGGKLPDRVLPPGGCSASGTEPVEVAWSLLLAGAVVLLLRRHALRALLGALIVLSATSCNSKATGTVIEVELKLDAVFAATREARIVLSPTDATMFPATTTPTEIKKGLTVVNRDVDGDGKVDIVVEFANEYPFKNSNKFSLQASNKSTAAVNVRAEVYDDRGDRFAEATDARTFTPDQTIEVALAPACYNAACVATQKETVSPALASGTLTGISSFAMTTLGTFVALVVGSESFGPSESPNQGKVVVFPRNPAAQRELLPVEQIKLVGAHAGDRFGAAVAVADLDGDGTEDLIVGAPGLRGNGAGGRGAVYVIHVPVSTTPTDVPLSGANVAAIMGEADGDRFGSSLSIGDVDGDGKKDVIIGAPGSGSGAGAIYFAKHSSFTFGTLDKSALGLTKVAGAAGAQLGAASAQAGTTIAAGAPGAKSVYLVSGAGTTLGKITGAGGDFGASVQALDFDRDGALDLAVGAPSEGAGAAYLFASARLTGDGTAADAAAVLHGATSSPNFARSLASVPSADGDALVAGAPGKDSSTTGSAYLVRASVIARVPNISMGADGVPSSSWWNASDLLGQQIITRDFDGDGFIDILAASASNLYIFFGPNL